MTRHHHHHHADASAAGRHRGRLVITLALMGSVLIAQVIGGLLSGSLALLADAGHTLTDLVGVVLALTAIIWAARPAPPNRTFGRYRVEVLSAVVNALLLIVVGIIIIVEAIQRWSAPGDVRGGVMIVVASLTLVVNLTAVILLRRGAAESITVKGAYLEVLSDAIGTVGVLVAALVITVNGWTQADAIASLAIVVLIVPRAVWLLRDAWRILAEAAPDDIDLGHLRDHLMQVPGVLDVHDLHVWTITSGQPIMSAHVVVSPTANEPTTPGRVLDALEECARSEFSITHCTFQIEEVGHRGHEGESHP